MSVHDSKPQALFYALSSIFAHEERKKTARDLKSFAMFVLENIAKKEMCQIVRCRNNLIMLCTHNT